MKYKNKIDFNHNFLLENYKGEEVEIHSERGFLEKVKAHRLFVDFKGNKTYLEIEKEDGTVLYLILIDLIIKTIKKVKENLSLIKQVVRFFKNLFKKKRR